MNKFLLIFFCFMLLAGCASGGNQAITQPNNLGRIQEGKSTKADVQNEFGTPARITPLRDGELWDYSYSQTSIDPVLGISNKTSQLSVFFDKQGIVSKIQAGNDMRYDLQSLKKMMLMN
jgi:outer membrane protein assembly factor BamE (lipoprotein component of BamABCDE complex)